MSLKQIKPKLLYELFFRWLKRAITKRCFLQSCQSVVWYKCLTKLHYVAQLCLSKSILNKQNELCKFFKLTVREISYQTWLRSICQVCRFFFNWRGDCRDLQFCKELQKQVKRLIKRIMIICQILSATKESSSSSFIFNGSLHPKMLHCCHLLGFTVTSLPKP